MHSQFESNTNYKSGSHQHFGPLVYRLGRKIFILEGGVRFPYGLPNIEIDTIVKKAKWQIINQQSKESDNQMLVV